MKIIEKVVENRERSSKKDKIKDVSHRTNEQINKQTQIPIPQWQQHEVNRTHTRCSDTDLKRNKRF